MCSEPVGARIGLLGPLLVSIDGRRRTVPQGRQRTLLARLALQPQTLVTSGDLIEAIWPSDAPSRPREYLNVCAMRLRRSLAADGLVRTERGGYLLDVAPDRIDLHRFRELAARHGHGDRESLGRALALWRGEFLQDVAAPSDYRELIGLPEEQRVAVLVRWARADTAAGHAAAAAAQLAALPAHFTASEQVSLALAESLQHCGREREALAALEGHRNILCEEFGIDPGPEVARLARQIRSGIGVSGPQSQLDELVGLLDADGAGGSIVVIGGMAGVGKTDLALRAAERDPRRRHLVRVDLHDGSRRPLPAADAAARLLAAIGVGVERGVESGTGPAATDSTVSRWRAEAARRDLLVLLDDAHDSAQVRPLLPARGRSSAIVTSRHRLSRLGAHRLTCLPTAPGPGTDGPTPGGPVRAAFVRAIEHSLQGLPHQVVSAFVDVANGGADGVDTAGATRSTDPSESTFRVLFDQHLLEEPRAGHFTMHPLLRTAAGMIRG